MMKRKFSRIVLILIAFIFCLISSNIFSCTGVQLKAKDGSYVNGRTVEFDMPLQLSAAVIPRNYEFKGTLPDGSVGLVYHSKYAAVGGSAYGDPTLLDGINEKGLSTGAFYFPDYAQYAGVTAENKNHALSPTEFTNWLLTQFATVDEVKQGLKSVVIVPTTPKGWPVLPPFHYIVYDKSGKSIVIEPIHGQLKVYDNPLGVITNSPSFDWHLTNLANYIKLSPMNVSSVTLNGLKLKEFGQGSGMQGLPGDFTPPSRFIRAAFFSTAAIPANNATDAVFEVFHILNQFDIPPGAVRSVQNNKVIPELTYATTVKDSQNLKYYFRTYEDQTIKMVNLNAFDLNAKKIKVAPVEGTQAVVDISDTLK